MVQTSCPFCSFSRSWLVRGKKRKCKQCRREFSGKRYPVSGFRLEKEDWRKIVGIFLKERTSKRLQEEMSLSEKSARKVTHHLRVVMATEVPLVFTGIVEMDETYIGGQRKNKKLHIRRIKGKKGHGTDKLPIVGLFCRNTKQIFVDVEPKKLDVSYIFQTIQKHVTPGSKVYTDGFKMYRGLSQIGYTHEFVDHAGGEYVRGDVHTNNIEGFWGIMKRKMGCIGGMRRDRLHLFVGEIVWKFNHRKDPHKEQERALFALVLLN